MEPLVVVSRRAVRHYRRLFNPATNPRDVVRKLEDAALFGPTLGTCERGTLRAKRAQSQWRAVVTYAGDGVHVVQAVVPADMAHWQRHIRPWVERRIEGFAIPEAA